MLEGGMLHLNGNLTSYVSSEVSVDDLQIHNFEGETTEGNSVGRRLPS